MLERTVYFSGPSGTGKTTLIRQLLSQNSVYISGNPEKLDRTKHVRDKAKSEKEYSKTVQYAIGKIDERVAEAQFHAELETSQPDKIVLGDRCLHDTISYINAAFRYGDLSEQEVRELLEYQERAYEDLSDPSHIVFMSYPLDDIKRYLMQRQEEEGPSFREDDDSYLGIVSDCFDEHFMSLDCVLSITTPYDATPERIDAWIKRRILLSA